MATNENLITIPGRLHSVATEGHVSGADEIYDDTQQKDQETINSELIAAVGTGGLVDSRISAAVNVEKTRAEGAESTLDDKITTEKTRAEAAEEALGGRVSTLEDAVGTGGSVDSKIAAEKNRAKAAEQANANAIAAEETRAKAAELVNSTAITNEVSRAQNAETALGNRITPLEEEVGTGGTIDQRIENATKNAAYIDASEQGSENVNW